MSLSLDDNMCSLCGWPVGKGYVIEHGDDDDGSRAYEFVCRKCALNDDKLKEIAMKDQKQIDKDKMNALDNLIYLFAGLGLVGIIALIVKCLRQAADFMMLFIFIAISLVTAGAWLTAGGACVYWLLTA